MAALCQSIPPLTPKWFDDAGSATGSATPSSVKVDAANNVYVTGSFTGAVDFDPAPGTATTLVAPSGSTYGFIAKYTSDGALVWAYTFAGPNVFPTALALGSGGSISVTGRFSGTMDANPNAGTNNLVSVDGYDAFVIHLGPAAAYLWAHDIGGTGEESGNAVASDANGDTYVGLQFQSTITVGSNSYPPQGITDGMLIKYSALGDVLFAIDLGYAGLENTVTGVAVDKNGNADVIGYLNGPVNFDPLGPTPRRTSARNALFIVQYTPDGRLNWINNFVSNLTSNTDSFKIALDGFNRVYVVGSFERSVQYLLNASLNANGVRDLFVGQYSDGGGFITFRNIGGTGATIVPTDIAISPDNDSFYITGSFLGTVDFGFNPTYVPTAYHGRQDLFLAKYNISNFNLEAVATSGSSSCSNVNGLALAPTSDNDVMLAGIFCSNVDFGATCSVPETAKANYDMLLARYTESTPIANNIISNPANCGGGSTSLVGGLPTGGIGTYTYKWQRSTDGTNFTEIDDPKGKEKDYPPPTETGVVYYLRKVFSGTCTVSLSNVLKVDPSSPIVQNNVINPIAPPESNEGCGGAGATNLTGSLPTGGGDVYTYQWQMSTNAVSWTNIQETIVTTPTHQNLGAISFLYSYYVRRLVFTPGCSTPSISPSMKFTALPNLENYTIHAEGTTTFCGPGDPGKLTGDKPPVGGSGVYTYKWRSSLAGSADNFEDIPGAINADYYPGVLTQTTYFKREVYAGPCQTDVIGRNSNQITVTIKKFITVTNNTITTPDGTLCLANANPSLITGAAAGGGTGTFLYQWQESIDNVHYTDVSGAKSKDYDPPKITQTMYYRRVVTYSDDDNSNTCATPNLSNDVAVKISPANVSNNTISQLVPDPAVICSIPAKPKKMTGSDATGIGFTYQWQTSPDGFHFTSTGVTTRDYDPPEISQTTYYRRAAVVSDNCLEPVYSNIIAINVSPTASSNIITAPAQTVFCDNGDASVIRGSDVTGNGVHYQWQSSPDGKPNTFKDIEQDQAIYPNYDPDPSNVHMYYRRLVTTNVCNVPSASAVVAIKVFPTPVATVSADSVYVCEGDKVTLMAFGGTEYKWTPAIGLSATDIASPKASPKTTTLYSVQVSNGDGACSANALVKVIVVPRPIVNAGADTRMFRGESIKLNGKVTGENVHYSWSPAAYLDDPNSLTPVATPPQTMTYTLTATTDHGCTIISDEVKINVYERVIIPTAFTPNSDGRNDLWEIPALSTYPGNILTVFNRNGTELFRTVSYAQVWDGTYRGKALPFGTYYYVIDLKDGTKPLSGWVSLIR